MSVFHLAFAGYLQPADVPPDPSGIDWRGIPGATGAVGPAGPMGPAGLPINLIGLPTTLPALAGVLWLNGGVVCVS